MYLLFCLCKSHINLHFCNKTLMLYSSKNICSKKVAPQWHFTYMLYWLTVLDCSMQLKPTNPYFSELPIWPFSMLSPYCNLNYYTIKQHLDWTQEKDYQIMHSMSNHTMFFFIQNNKLDGSCTVFWAKKCHQFKNETKNK